MPPRVELLPCWCGEELLPEEVITHLKFTHKYGDDILVSLPLTELMGRNFGVVASDPKEVEARESIVERLEQPLTRSSFGGRGSVNVNTSVEEAAWEAEQENVKQLVEGMTIKEKRRLWLRQKLRKLQQRKKHVPPKGKRLRLTVLDLVMDNVKSRLLGTFTFLSFCLFLFWRIQIALFPPTYDFVPQYEAKLVTSQTLSNLEITGASSSEKIVFSVRGDAPVADGAQFVLEAVLRDRLSVRSPMRRRLDGFYGQEAAFSKQVDFTEPSADSFRYRELRAPKIKVEPSIIPVKDGLVECDLSLLSAVGLYGNFLSLKPYDDTIQAPAVLLDIYPDTKVESVHVVTENFPDLFGQIRERLPPIQIQVLDAVGRPLPDHYVLAVAECRSNEYSPESIKITVLEDAWGSTDENGVATLQPFVAGSNTEDLFISFYCDGYWTVWNGKERTMPLKLLPPKIMPTKVEIVGLDRRIQSGQWISFAVVVTYPDHYDFTDDQEWKRYAFLKLCSMFGVDFQAHHNPFLDSVEILGPYAEIYAGRATFTTKFKASAGSYTVYASSDGVDSEPHELTIVTNVHKVSLWPPQGELVQDCDGTVGIFSEFDPIKCPGLGDSSSRTHPYVRVSDVFGNFLDGKEITFQTDPGDIGYAVLDKRLETNNEGIALSVLRLVNVTFSMCHPCSIFHTHIWKAMTVFLLCGSPTCIISTLPFEHSDVSRVYIATDWGLLRILGVYLFSSSQDVSEISVYAVVDGVRSSSVTVRLWNSVVEPALQQSGCDFPTEYLRSPVNLLQDVLPTQNATLFEVSNYEMTILTFERFSFSGGHCEQRDDHRKGIYLYISRDRLHNPSIRDLEETVGLTQTIEAGKCFFDDEDRCTINLIPIQAIGGYWIYPVVFEETDGGRQKPLRVMQELAKNNWLFVVDSSVERLESKSNVTQTLGVTFQHDATANDTDVVVNCWPRPPDCGYTKTLVPFADLLADVVCGNNCTASDLTLELKEENCPRVTPPYVYRYRVLRDDEYIFEITSALLANYEGGITSTNTEYPRREILDVKGEIFTGLRGVLYKGVTFPELSDGIAHLAEPLQTLPQYPGQYVLVCSADGLQTTTQVSTPSKVESISILAVTNLKTSLKDAREFRLALETDTFGMDVQFNFDDDMNSQTGFRFELFATPVDDVSEIETDFGSIQVKNPGPILLSQIYLSAVSLDSGPDGVASITNVHFHTAQSGACYYVVAVFARGESFQRFANSTSCHHELENCYMVCVEHQVSCTVVKVPASVTLGSEIGNLHAPLVYADSGYLNPAIREVVGVTAVMVAEIVVVGFKSWEDDSWEETADALESPAAVTDASGFGMFNKAKFVGPEGYYAIQFRVAGQLCLHDSIEDQAVFVVRGSLDILSLSLSVSGGNFAHVGAPLPLISVSAIGATGGVVPFQYIRCFLRSSPEGGDIDSLNLEVPGEVMSSSSGSNGVATFDLIIDEGPSGQYVIAFETLDRAFSTEVSFDVQASVSNIEIVSEPLPGPTVLLLQSPIDAGWDPAAKFVFKVTSTMQDLQMATLVPTLSGVTIEHPPISINSTGYGETALDFIFKQTGSLDQVVNFKCCVIGVCSQPSNVSFALHNQFLVDVDSALGYENVMWVSLLFWTPLFSFNFVSRSQTVRTVIGVSVVVSIVAVALQLADVADDFQELPSVLTTRMLIGCISVAVSMMFILMALQVFLSADRQFHILRALQLSRWERPGYIKERSVSYMEHVRRLLKRRSLEGNPKVNAPGTDDSEEKGNRKGKALVWISSTWKKFWRLELLPYSGMRKPLYERWEEPVFYFPQRVVFAISLSITVLLLGIVIWRTLELRIIKRMMELKQSSAIFSHRYDLAKFELSDHGLVWVSDLLEAASAYFPLRDVAGEIQNFVDMMAPYVDEVFKLAGTLAFCNSLWNLFCLARLYRLRVLLLRRGYQNFLRQFPVSPQKAATFVMFQTMYTIVGYFVTSFFFVIILGIMVAFMLSSPLRLLVSNQVVQALAGMLSATFIITLSSKLVCKFVLVDRKTNDIRFRYLFAIFDTFWTFLSLLTGFVSSITRYPLLLVSIALFQARTDFSFLPSFMESFDAAFQAYCSTIVTDYTYNHPICHAFFTWMEEIRVERRRETPSESGSASLVVENIEKARLTSSVENGDTAAKGELRMLQKTRLRNYLWLLVTLHNNPRIRRFRHFVPNDEILTEGIMKERRDQVEEQEMQIVSSNDAKP